MTERFDLRIACVVMLISILSACSDDNTPSSPSSQPQQTRFLYTSTNSSIPSEGNHVVGFKIKEDGYIEEFGNFATGGIGDADDDDFDGQGSIRIIGNKLLVVNAGESLENNQDNATTGNGTISVFEIDDTSGELIRIDQQPNVEGIQNIDSFGIRPVTLDSITINDTTWVVVGNQTDTNFCITPAESESTLENCQGITTETIGEYFTRVEPLQPRRNIYLYRFQDGVLTPVKKLDDYDARVSGPAQVGFSPDGNTLAVTTVGIGHVNQVSNPNLQTPSRVVLYDLVADADTFELSNKRWFSNPNISASVGFSWSSNSDYLYVSNALLAQDLIDYSVMSLEIANTDTVFSSDNNSVPSAGGDITINQTDDDRPAACWTWLSQNDSHLYSVAFRANLVANYQVDGIQLSKLQEAPRQTIEVHDSKDIYVSADEKTAYVLGALQTHTVSIYDIVDGLLIEKTNSPLQVSASIDPETGETRPTIEHFYLGIAGYPNYYTGF